MKILALNGSHRGAAGCTQWLLERIAEGARAAGAEFETVVLAEQNIKRCSGCETCHTPGHLLRCVYEQEDDVKAIHAKMKAADILIYATPVYIFGLTGLMKTFLDRFNSTVGGDELGVTDSGLFFHRTDRAFHGKPFVVLTCCGNVEGETTKNVISYFRTVAKFLDAPLVGVLARKSVGLLRSEAAPAGKRQEAAVAAVTVAYVQAGRELASQGRITAKTAREANQQLLGIPLLGLILKFPFLKRLALRRKSQ
ncbi:MAG: flavodoxin family protein [Negativicutes bacterium]|nr:flavodoxin family protein [Negativicutes bacterium]